MILSSGADVSWRLNDLLVAGQKARYLATKVPDSSGHVSAEPSSEFSLWSPRVIKLLGKDEPKPTANELLETNENPQSSANGADEKSREDLEAQLKQAEQAQEQRLTEAYEAGRLAGEKKITEQVQQHEAALLAIIAGLQKSQANLTEFYEPLTRLALHLAQELVRGELTLSNSVIERLVKSAIDTIESSGEGPIVASLNIDDFKGLDQEFRDRYAHVEFIKDHHLTAGSVRVTMDATAIEDFIEDRLQTLADQILGSGDSRPLKTMKRRQAPKPVDIDGDATAESAADSGTVATAEDPSIASQSEPSVGSSAEQITTLNASAELNHESDPQDYLP